MTRRLEIWGVTGIGEIAPGADLAREIAAVAPELRDGDVVVVTSKVVSKAERRLVAVDREEAIDSESVRLVARRGATRIVETSHGFVLAAAGVDASNVPTGTVALLPVDPDASARRIRDGLRELAGADVAVIVTDTFGRPWRNGLVDVAIGAAGISALDDHRGRTDAQGRTLEMTVTAVADEVAAAAELVKGKLGNVPVAIVRGLDHGAPQPDEGARPLIRAAGDDMFRLGTQEAMHAALLAMCQDERPPAADPLDAALAAAAAAPAPAPVRPWQFVVTREPPVAGTNGLAVVACLPEGDSDEPGVMLGLGAAIGSLTLSLAIDGARPRWAPADSIDAAALTSLRVPEGYRPVAVVLLDRP